MKKYIFLIFALMFVALGSASLVFGLLTSDSLFLILGALAYVIAYILNKFNELVSNNYY